ncbi:MAG: AAA family ATPase [Chloroflexaceae bacterium]|nr:AAA family ATPase [Chloroflexaceae bacterium]
MRQLAGRLLLGLLALWMAWNLLRLAPAVLAFLMTPLFGLTVFVIFLIGLNLFVLIGFLFFLIYSFGRTPVTWLAVGQIDARFDEYYGDNQVRDTARSLVTLLQAGASRAVTRSISRGVLFWGAEGSGKQFLARAIAAEARVPSAYINARAFKAGWLGTDNLKGRLLARKVQRRAQQYGGCLLFIDELDVLGHPDSGPLNELLLYLRTSTTTKRGWRRWLPWRRQPRSSVILTIGSTSQPQQPDALLLQTGYFRQVLSFPPLETESRYQLARASLEPIACEPAVLDRLVYQTNGATAGLIRAVIHEATLYARMDQRTAMTDADIDRALQAHRHALPAPLVVYSYAERRRSAYHQAGHTFLQALYGMATNGQYDHDQSEALDEFPLADIDDREGPLSRQELLHRLHIALAGRAAEEELLSVQTTAAARDLSQATAIAARIIGLFGMDGYLFSFAAVDPQSLGRAMEQSDLRERINTLLLDQYHQVRRQIAQNRMVVTAIAEALLLCDTLTDGDVAAIVSNQPQWEEAV